MNGIGKAILKFDPQGRPIGVTKQNRHVAPTYTSISDAARKEGRDCPVIRTWLRKGHDPAGNLWRYAG